MKIKKNNIQNRLNVLKALCQIFLNKPIEIYKLKKIYQFIRT